MPIDKQATDQHNNAGISAKSQSRLATMVKMDRTIVMITVTAIIVRSFICSPKVALIYALACDDESSSRSAASLDMAAKSREVSINLSCLSGVEAR